LFDETISGKVSSTPTPLPSPPPPPPQPSSTLFDVECMASKDFKDYDHIGVGDMLHHCARLLKLRWVDEAEIRR
jgi:hypothetical protein